MGRPKAEIVLSDSEREQLEAWTRRRKTAQALALRSRIILECASGVDSKVVAQRVSVSQQMVSKWRNRFVANRLDGLFDAPRSGAPRTIDDARVDAVIAKTLETVPKNATHWSTRGMAREMGLSQTAVSRIWRAFGLQPHRQETFKLSTDPLFVDKVRDIVGLYLDPPVKAMVLCVDEKSQIQSGDGQLRHTQDAQGQKLVCPSSAFPRSFHADLGLLDQPGRALVCRAHRKTDPSRHAPLHSPTRAGHPRLPCTLQRRPQTIRMDQIR